MSVYSQRYPGEQDFLSIHLSHGPDGVALAYPVDDDGIPIRTALSITNYRTLIFPMRGPSVISVPHMMLDTWELERHALTAAQRAAFPQTASAPALAAGSGGTSNAVSNKAHNNGSSTSNNNTSSSASPFSDSSAPVAFTLTLNTNYLWTFKVIFQDERQATTARRLMDSLRPSHIKRMPAFEMYTAFVNSPELSVGGSATAVGGATTVQPMSQGEAGGAVGDGVDGDAAPRSPQVQPADSPAATEDKSTASTTNRSKQAVKSGDGAVVLDPMNFGWNIFNCEREMNRQLTLDPSAPIPVLADDSVAAAVADSSVTTESSPTALKPGVGKDLRNWFHVTNIAQDDNVYGRSPTYPFQIVAPNAASEPHLAETCFARSRGRIPAISYVHLGSGAVLARSSQTLQNRDQRKDGDLCNMLINSGYTIYNTKPKEQRSVDPHSASSVMSASRAVAPPPSLIDSSSAASSLALTAPSPTYSNGSGSGASASTKRQRTLQVADCRSYSAAYGNQTLGGGFENSPHHDVCRVKFHNIDNIHGVSKAFQKLRSLIHQFNGKCARENFLGQLAETQWLYHIQRILLCSQEVAENLDRGESCLVHCTDGWDRTSQCTSIAMLLLDPFYRTAYGFCLLIEKEFCSFGHKFAERCNHMVPGDTCSHVDVTVSSDSDASAKSQPHKLQPSPIFVQYLDCIFQIVRQFPNMFEFTPKLLEFLSFELYSCLYGTFLANSEKERMFEGIRRGTVSLWSAILKMVKQERDGALPPFFVNPAYDSHEAYSYISKQKNCGIQLLPLSTSSKRLVFWEEHYLRFDSDNLSLRILPNFSAGETSSSSSSSVRPRMPFHEKWIEYFDNEVRLAMQRRVDEVAYMTELLTRLQVQRPSPAATKAVLQQAATGQSTAIDTKSCWQCHEKFGFFSAKEYCSTCVVKAPLCSKCVYYDKATQKKFCGTCLQAKDMAYDDE